jgi:hypothetical protein
VLHEFTNDVQLFGHLRFHVFTNDVQSLFAAKHEGTENISGGTSGLDVTVLPKSNTGYVL